MTKARAIAARKTTCGQAFVEAIVTLPVLLLATFGLIQLALLAWMGLRTQAAADAAARSFAVHGDLARARQAAATVLAPAGLMPDSSHGPGASALRDAHLRAGFLAGVRRLSYTLARTDVSVCRLPGPAGQRPAQLNAGDVLRMRVRFVAPLLMPVAAPLLADGSTLPPPPSAVGSSAWGALVSASFAATAGFDRSYARTLMAWMPTTWPGQPAATRIPLCVT